MAPRRIVSRFAASEGWLDRVLLRAEHRWYERLYLGPDHDIWASIDQVLSAARARLRRLSSAEAFLATAEAKAILVDIRPEAQRAVEGRIPDAVIVERNVLEWRFDPASSSRLPIVIDHDLQVIIFCSEGYTSSLAAASLQDLGLWRATDIVGGLHAGSASGLPTTSPGNSIW